MVSPRTLSTLLLLLLGAAVVLCIDKDNCHNYGPTISIKSPISGLATVGCFHEGRFRKLGLKWSSSQCESCDCTSDGIQCCLSISKPVMFPDDCRLDLDVDQCKYNLVKKNNPSEKCFVQHMSLS
ncbi:beta-microseminoprotein-like isoform X1 [Petromyzon marinus]|uniref:Beta-microseminoprotein-like isoform X1 n=1 Tax=Petromyzon marinus TaxID=7757 RepID=A0AAJ7SVF6_PETMA|nr:beta-microseminoprotein-like isoform X1 [Petromyzon marinus]